MGKRFNQKGLDGLKDKLKGGRKPKLTVQDMQRIKEVVINESPQKYGFNTGTWTAPLIVKWIEQNCNVKYSDDNVYIILKEKLGLRYKKGKGFYPEADKEKRANFIVAIKKT
jgi:transposase